jgi:hypothetical protein
MKNKKQRAIERDICQEYIDKATLDFIKENRELFEELAKL